MVFMLCLSFIGQSLAATVMSYQMMAMKGMSMQEMTSDMPTMDHCDHHMASNSTSDSSEGSDCCAKSCDCYTGGCSSVAMLIEHISNDLTFALSHKASSTSHLALSQRLTSLYRPPIFS